MKKVKKSDKKPYKEQDYEMFILWKSLPSLIRGKPKEELQRAWGFHDEVILELLQIKTNVEFAKKFNIKGPNTLTEWQKLPDYQDRVSASWKSWMKKATPDVNASFIRKTIQEGDAPRFKLFHQIAEGFTEKIEANGKGLQTIINLVYHGKARQSKTEEENK
jgi:hypothetical protein